MSINTYNKNFQKIYNEKLKWYDEFNIGNEIPTSDINNRLWFNTDGIINLVNYDNLIPPANLNNIELSGPDGTLFTKNKDYNLEPFSTFIITKINKLGNKLVHTLFELGLQTNIIDTIETNKADYDKKYEWGIISLIMEEEYKFSKNSCTIKIILRFGKKKYEWTNLSNNFLINKNILIGLIFDGKNVRLILNDLSKKFVYNKNEENKLAELKLGSNPLIINKKGTINMELFNFTFYNKELNDVEIDLFLKYNNYYINKLNENFLDMKKAIKDLDECVIGNNSKISTLQTELINKELELDKIKKEYNFLLENKHSNVKSTDLNINELTPAPIKSDKIHSDQFLEEEINKIKN